jgi:glutathione S-transferase
MITLCGFALSNYYNKVKIALLEKGVPFQEEPVAMGPKDESVLSASPLGKVPFIRTPDGNLCESQVICDWIEAAYPTPALVPANAFAAAKVRELCTFLDLHIELVGRELYGQALLRRQLPARDAGARAQAADEEHRRLQAAGEVLALRGRRTVHAGRLLGLCHAAHGGRRPARRCWATTCWPAPASTGRAT